jgi:cbb3-type cytochrome oxidase maturation protein
MFYFAWIILVAAGLLASLGVFLWALRTGQFFDQERARYLPLSDPYPLPPVENPSKLSREVYALILVIGIGLLGMIVTIFLTLTRVKG